MLDHHIHLECFLINQELLWKIRSCIHFTPKYSKFHSGIFYIDTIHKGKVNEFNIYFTPFLVNLSSNRTLLHKAEFNYQLLL